MDIDSGLTTAMIDIFEQTIRINKIIYIYIYIYPDDISHVYPYIQITGHQGTRECESIRPEGVEGGWVEGERDRG